jgi:hypothetical protein
MAGHKPSVAGSSPHPDNELVKQAQDLESLPDEQRESESENAAPEQGIRFDDPYWDDAFCVWWDPTLRTCC